MLIGKRGRVTLKYPSAAAFAQAIRFRLQALPDNVPILAVEGVSDRQAICRVAHPAVRVFPARGKEMVLRSREHLSADERLRCTFLIDCDGQVDASWLSDGDVVVSANRDLEADLVIELHAMQSVARDFLAPLFIGGEELAVEVSRLQDYVLEVTAVLGVVLDTARAQGRRTKLYDITEGRKRRVRPLDVPEVQLWLQTHHLPSLLEVAAALGSVLGWDESAVAEIASTATQGGAKLCARHHAQECRPCLARRFSNGHDIVDVAAIVLSDQAGYVVSSAEIARSLRIALGGVSSATWLVTDRLRRRGELIGLPLVAA